MGRVAIIALSRAVDSGVRKRHPADTERGPRTIQPTRKSPQRVAEQKIGDWAIQDLNL